MNQLDSLNEWRKLDSITINRKDNPINEISIWRYYLLNRLSNLQLKKINDQLITLDDLNMSNKLFAPIKNLACNLPEYRLMNIVGTDKYAFIYIMFKPILYRFKPNFGVCRRKLIKLARSTSSSNQVSEQLIARETISKAVITSSLSQLKRTQTQMNNASFVKANSYSIGESHQHQHQFQQKETSTSSIIQGATNQNQNQAAVSLLKNVYSQINYNDLKKKKINQIKAHLWTQILDACLHNSLQPDTHVNDLCKKFKICL